MKLKWIATCTSALFLVGLFASSLASAQALPVKGGVIQACVKTKGKKKQLGTIRIVKSATQCKRKKGEQAVTWSLQGPTGPAGPTGASGSQGTPGSSGATGAQGATGENTTATTEAQMREIITRQNKEENQVESLNTGLLNLDTELGSLEDVLGKVGVSVGTIEGVLGENTAGLGNLETTVETAQSTVTEALGKLTALEGGIGGLKQTVGETTETVKGLGGKLATQCTSLTEVGKQGNGLLTVVGKILGVPVISTVLGSVETPKETKAPVC